MQRWRDWTPHPNLAYWLGALYWLLIYIGVLFVIAMIARGRGTW